NVLWTHQFGTDELDLAHCIAADASGIYVAGTTDGTFPGQTNAGGVDAFVRKYDFAGTVLWTHQFGTGGFDEVSGVAVSGSGVYLAGRTHGTLPDQASAGGPDAFVRKSDPSGGEQWIRQFGAANADVAFGVAADASGVYVAGIALGTLPGQASAGNMDAFVRKYDADGNVPW